MKIVPVTLAANARQGREGVVAYEVRFNDGKLAPIHTRGEMAPQFDSQGVPTCGHGYFAREIDAARYALAVSEASRQWNERKLGNG